MLSNPYPGLFIALEGIDGSGKSVQIDLIAQYLRDVYLAREKDIFKTHEPTSSHYGREIRKILAHKAKAPETPLAFQELFIKDRKEGLANEIIPHLQKNGSVVLCDRYLLGTFVYGLAQGLGYGELMRLHQEILGEYFIYPDAMFIIDIDPKVALMRLQKREGAHPLEYFEEKSDLIKEAAINYRRLAEKFTNTYLIDGDGTIAEVSEHIFKIIAKEKKMKHNK